MKKITGISLAFIFILYLGGAQLFYLFKIDAAKQQSVFLIKNCEVPLNNSCIFSFTPTQYSELNWSERNKEFTYSGHQYDIIGIRFTLNKVEVTCYNDNNETQIVDAFITFMGKMFSPQKQTSGDNNNDLLSKIFKEYLLSGSLTPSIFPQVPNAVKPGCVLVITSPATASVWRPPCI